MDGFKKLMKEPYEEEDEDMEKVSPRFDLMSKNMPQIKDWEVGDMKTVKVRVVSKTENEDGMKVCVELE
jgi:hypothetical protein